jgi:hypothetical protein
VVNITGLHTPSELSSWGFGLFFLRSSHFISQFHFLNTVSFPILFPPPFLVSSCGAGFLIDQFYVNFLESIAQASKQCSSSNSSLFQSKSVSMFEVVVRESGS